ALAHFRLHIQVLLEGLQEDRIRPAMFDVLERPLAEVVPRMDPPAYPGFRFAEDAPIAGHPIAVDERVDRVAAAAPAPVTLPANRLAREARTTPIEPPAPAPTSVVDSHHPFGETLNGLRSEGVSSEAVIGQEPARVVVLARRASPAPVGIPVADVRPRVAPVRAGRRALVVLGVPEHSAVERRPVAIRVVDVDVDDVPRQIPHEIEPPPVSRPHVLDGGPVHHV